MNLGIVSYPISVQIADGSIPLGQEEFAIVDRVSGARVDNIAAFVWGTGATVNGLLVEAGSLIRSWPKAEETEQPRLFDNKLELDKSYLILAIRCESAAKCQRSDIGTGNQITRWGRENTDLQALSFDIHQALGLADKDGDLLGGVERLLVKVTELKRLNRLEDEEYEKLQTRVAELKQILGSAILRLQELGETSFKMDRVVDTDTGKAAVDSSEDEEGDEIIIPEEGAPSPCGDCGEWYCDHCTYKKELAVKANPCKACKGTGLGTEDVLIQELADGSAAFSATDSEMREKGYSKAPGGRWSK